MKNDNEKCNNDNENDNDSNNNVNDNNNRMTRHHPVIAHNKKVKELCTVGQLENLLTYCPPKQ